MKRIDRCVCALPLVLIASFAFTSLSASGPDASNDQATSTQAPSTVLGVDCSRIVELGIDRQANLRAAAIRIGCGVEPPGKPGTATAAPNVPLAAPANRNTITGGETYPHVTQSESSVWTSDGNTVVVNYNDSNTASGTPVNYSGVSTSADGGNTFTRLLPAPFATGHGNNYGDPILVFNARLQTATWFAGDLTTGCGGQGIGLWTSVDGFNWSVGACAHNGTDDDRESMWVDNSTTSPFAGRMYISWNDFASGQRIFVTHSDDGVSWTTPVALTSGFVRNVQVTGGPDGTVFVAAMDEGGGGLSLKMVPHPRFPPEKVTP